jgi:hypothetical protein
MFTPYAKKCRDESTGKLAVCLFETSRVKVCIDQLQPQKGIVGTSKLMLRSLAQIQHLRFGPTNILQFTISRCDFAVTYELCLLASHFDLHHS